MSNQFLNNINPKIDDFVNMLEPTISTDGRIDSQCLEFLNKNFEPELISIILYRLALVKIDKDQCNAAEMILRNHPENNNENGYIHFALGAALCRFEQASKLKDAEKELRIAKNLIEKEVESHDKKQYLLLIDEYLEYFKLSFDEVVCELIKKPTRIINNNSYFCTENNGNIGSVGNNNTMNSKDKEDEKGEK